MIKKRVFNFLIITLTFMQCFILINFENKKINKDLNVDDTYSISEMKNVKYIKEIIKELENNNTLTILGYNKLENNNYKLKCILEGKKEDILKDIESLSCYEIVSYNLNYENKKVFLELELINK